MYNEVKKQITKKHVIHSVYRTHPDDPGASNIFAAPRWTGGLMAAMLSMVLAASLECSDAFSSRSFATSSRLFRELCRVDMQVHVGIDDGVLVNDLPGLEGGAHLCIAILFSRRSSWSVSTVPSSSATAGPQDQMSKLLWARVRAT